MRECKKRWVFLLLCLLAVLVLPACGEDQLPPDPEEGVLVFAALNPQDKTIKMRVDLFNKSHEDVQIEMRDYSGEEGRQRFLVELMAGQVPDIMELHYFGAAGEILPYDAPGVTERPADEFWLPYRQLVQKGYLEDLWPYIENDPQLGRDAMLEPPLKAAEINGSLYIAFQKVRINTLSGDESVVGARYGWTFDQLMEAFATMPEDSTVLRYNTTKWEVYSKLLCYSLSEYVDWQTGECFFDSEAFRNMLEFLNGFPDEVEEESPYKTDEEVVWRILKGRQMLEGVQIAWPSNILYINTLWQGRAAFVGYPTAEGRSGSVFYPTGSIMAMSSTCRDKEAAWEFIAPLFRPRYKMTTVLAANVNIPVNLRDYETLIRANFNESQATDWDARQPMPPWPHFRAGPEIVPTSPLTEEDVQQYRDLVNSVTQFYWPDDDLADIVWDSCGSYFAGDRTMDDTVRLLNNRVGLYVNEQR